MPSEAMVRHIIGIEGAQALAEITRQAWQDYLSEDIPRHHPTTQAHIVWDYMAKHGDAQLMGLDGVQRTERHGRPAYILRDRLALRPKKHNRDFRTSNYLTPAQQKEQQTGLFEDTSYHVVSFGYTLDALDTGIEQTVLTSPAQKWVIDLDGLAGGQLAATTPVLPHLDDTSAWEHIAPITRQRGA